jgi:hypothetical protein
LVLVLKNFKFWIKYNKILSDYIMKFDLEIKLMNLFILS